MTTDLRSEYLAQSVLNATPATLVTMLYDRLLLDISRARKAIEAGDKAGCNAAALHAQDIVAELMTTLDVTAWAGAGIVVDSDPAHELVETRMKFRPILEAFAPPAD